MFLSFLVLLLIPLTSANLSETFQVFANLHDFDVRDEEGEDDILDALDLPSWNSGHSNKNVVNVEGFGAVGDGVADDTKVLYIYLCCESCFKTMWQSQNLIMFSAFELGLCGCMETSLFCSKISFLGS